ncbi:tRNA 2-thiocytidine biosynthesis TtcA family protein [Anaerotalea alkaliphila]|uniref:tRNA 2-thiocytidine biosynthesis protein TtcA n=1 Tax=Anaerotalea alkaliphila TaxID=2662126 RepID=A0A7X5KPR0_9FIRM|nr:ATP-binding protein [Anaerotalea alkaliphila]NDL68762.1 tRNA 2-thiocytidine biosynthesis protein TtcA [Anaerotalea alkaliphila]
MDTTSTRTGGTGCPVLRPLHDRLPLKEIERSIIKTYRKDLWAPFTKAVKAFRLVEEGDHIAVGISGGKDSLAMAKLFQELHRHGQVSFRLSFIAMDPGFYATNREMLLDNCAHLGIPVEIYESQIFEVIDEIAADYPCYMCARMRRGSLYAKAQELGCNKLALGHHFDDVIETTLMNLFYAGTFKTMMPRLKSTNFENMELIRPMYYVHEEGIKRFTVNAGLSPMNCGCVVAAQRISTKRNEMKDLVQTLKELSPDIDKSIMNAAGNVNMDCVLGWSKGKERHSFLDTYMD